MHIFIVTIITGSVEAFFWTWCIYETCLPLSNDLSNVLSNVGTLSLHVRKTKTKSMYDTKIIL